MVNIAGVGLRDSLGAGVAWNMTSKDWGRVEGAGDSVDDISGFEGVFISRSGEVYKLEKCGIH